MKVNVVSFVLFGMVACERAPSADKLKEWTPADHDQAREQAPPPSPRGSGASPHGAGPHGATPDNEELDTAALAALLWKQQCGSCHGVSGLGDGPASATTKPPSLASAEWQKATTDAQIAKTITTGKGKMPKFEMPEAVVRALIFHIRTLGGAPAANDKAKGDAGAQGKAPVKDKPR